MLRLLRQPSGAGQACRHPQSERLHLKPHPRLLSRLLHISGFCCPISPPPQSQQSNRLINIKLEFPSMRSSLVVKYISFPGMMYI